MSSNRKSIFVTGAASGLGREVSRYFAGKDWFIGLADVNEAGLKETADMLPAGQWSIHKLDVTNRPQWKEAVAEFAKHTDGKMDVLFNNAGTGAPAIPLEDLTIAQWRAVVDINLTGAFLCTREAIRLMKAQTPRGGRIINNGSISAHAPRPNSAPYTATKHAISGLTKTIALDGRRYGIACGQIDIGNAGTEMTEKMKTGMPQANGTTAPEPTMDVENVARTVLYMASLPLEANAQFVTVMATKMPYIGRG